MSKKRMFVEGLSGAGKTTFCEELGSMGIPIVSEITKFFGLSEIPGHGRSVSEAESTVRWFIKYEEERLRNSGVFDRSFFSDLAFYYAFSRLTGEREYFSRTTDIYLEALNQGKLHMPSGFVFLDVSPKVAKENLAKRELFGERRLQQIWYDENFLKDVIKAYESLYEVLGVKKIKINILEDKSLNCKKVISLWELNWQLEGNIEDIQSFVRLMRKND